MVSKSQTYDIVFITHTHTHIFSQSQGVRFGSHCDTFEVVKDSVELHRSLQSVLIRELRAELELGCWEHVQGFSSLLTDCCFIWPQLRDLLVARFKQALKKGTMGQCSPMRMRERERCRMSGGKERREGKEGERGTVPSVCFLSRPFFCLCVFKSIKVLPRKFIML